MYNQVSFLGSVYLFLLFVFGSAQSMAQGAAISPSRIFLSGPAGQTLSQQIEITNTGTKKLLFNVSVKDWNRDSLGTKQYYPAGTLATSNAGWLEINPHTIEVLPGSKKSVSMTMHIPTGAGTTAGVTNSMLFFTQLNEQLPMAVAEKGSGVGVNIQLEFGVHVYFTPQGLSRKELDFTGFKELPFKTGTNERIVALQLKNTGELVADAYLRFELTNKATGEELKIDPLAVSMLPLAEQIVPISLSPNLKGRYLMVAILDNGAGTNLKIAEKELVYE